jgi:hypothetical protein
MISCPATRGDDGDRGAHAQTPHAATCVGPSFGWLVDLQQDHIGPSRIDDLSELPAVPDGSDLEASVEEHGALRGETVADNQHPPAG